MVPTMQSKILLRHRKRARNIPEYANAVRDCAFFSLKRLKHVAINLQGNVRATCRDNTLKEER